MVSVCYSFHNKQGRFFLGHECKVFGFNWKILLKLHKLAIVFANATQRQIRYNEQEFTHTAYFHRSASFQHFTVSLSAIVAKLLLVNSS